MLKGIIGCALLVIGIIFGVFLWCLKDSIHHEYSAADKFKYAACIGGTAACVIVVILGSILAYTGWCDFFMGTGGTRIIG